MKDVITISSKGLIFLIIGAVVCFGGMVMAGVMLEREREKVAELWTQAAEFEAQVVELEAQAIDKTAIVHKAFYNDTCALLDMYEFDTWHIDRYSDGTYDFRATRDNISFRSCDLEGISDIRESAKSAYQALQALNR